MSKKPDIQLMRYEMDYLLMEVSRLRSIVRYLSADRINDLPLQRQTHDSFDFQWGDTCDGDWTMTRPELKEREPQLLCQYTKLPADWFAGKCVLDAGCGSGRFSWALAHLGAHVTAVDQSASGVAHTRAACAEFGEQVRCFQHDLTKPLPLDADFDFVFSFGVLHHTGDTYGSFCNISRLLKPGGYIFLMLYGEPESDPGAFSYYAEVERHRRATADMTLKDRYEYFRRVKGAEAGGWFDAVSPGINDTYPLHEIKVWLVNHGFVEIERTIEHPSHHVRARLAAEV